MRCGNNAQVSLAMTCKELVPFLLDGDVDLGWHCANGARTIPRLDSLSISLDKYPNTVTSVTVMTMEILDFAKRRRLPACSLPYRRAIRDLRCT